MKEPAVLEHEVSENDKSRPTVHFSIPHLIVYGMSVLTLRQQPGEPRRASRSALR